MALSIFLNETKPVLRPQKVHKLPRRVSEKMKNRLGQILPNCDFIGGALNDDNHFSSMGEKSHCDHSTYNYDNKVSHDDKNGQHTNANKANRNEIVNNRYSIDNNDVNNH